MRLVLWSAYVPVSGSDCLLRRSVRESGWFGCTAMCVCVCVREREWVVCAEVGMRGFCLFLSDSVRETSSADASTEGWGDAHTHTHT